MEPVADPEADDLVGDLVTNVESPAPLPRRPKEVPMDRNPSTTLAGILLMVSFYKGKTSAVARGMRERLDPPPTTPEGRQAAVTSAVTWLYNEHRGEFNRWKNAFLLPSMGRFLSIQCVIDNEARVDELSTYQRLKLKVELESTPQNVDGDTACHIHRDVLCNGFSAQDVRFPIVLASELSKHRSQEVRDVLAMLISVCVSSCFAITRCRRLPAVPSQQSSGGCLETSWILPENTTCAFPMGFKEQRVVLRSLIALM